MQVSSDGPAHYRTGDETGWFLAVPQILAQTVKLPKETTYCTVCQEPKYSTNFDQLEYDSPAEDIFKSKHWIGSKIGEKTVWYWMHILKLKSPPKVREGQWTRIRMSRELWFSVRLILLLKELGVRGFPYRDLEQRQPTKTETAWIAVQMEKLQSARRSPSSTGGNASAARVQSVEPDVKKWLTRFLKDNASTKPLATTDSLRAWSKTRGLQLPKDYQRFAKMVGRKTFRNLMGLDELDVRIVGPRQLDCDDYRRDRSAEPPDDWEPDGLMFAIAINGDCLCFDLRAGTSDYPVYYYDHETEVFTPYADNFAAALHRLASGE